MCLAQHTHTVLLASITTSCSFIIFRFINFTTKRGKGKEGIWMILCHLKMGGNFSYLNWRKIVNYGATGTSLLGKLDHL